MNSNVENLVERISKNWEILFKGKEINEQRFISDNTFNSPVNFIQRLNDNDEHIFILQSKDEISDEKSIELLKETIPVFNFLPCSIEPTANGYELSYTLTDDYIEEFNLVISQQIKTVSSKENSIDAFDRSITLFSNWINFLSEYKKNKTISRSAQIGLFGELWFLKNLLLNNIDSTKAIEGYRGKSGRQDFQFPNCIIEIKTSTAKLTQKMEIHGELQLSPPDLYLVFISIEERKKSNEISTLKTIVNDIREIIKNNRKNISMFEERLEEYGYIFTDEKEYDEFSFNIRNYSYFSVKGEFPRITEEMLPNGVGDITYKIDVSSCEDYKINEIDLYGLIR